MCIRDRKQAVLFIIVFLLLQQIEDNLIYPHVVGGSVGPVSYTHLDVYKRQANQFSPVLGMLLNIAALAVLIPVSYTHLIYQSIRKHPARFFSSCRVFSYAIQTQQKPESFLRIAFLFWVEFVNETNSSISKQVRPLNSTRMSFAFNINSITFSSCL